MIHAELHIAQPRRGNATMASHTASVLTEAEVRAMPDDQYMNADQLAFFEARLTELEANLIEKACRADVEIATGAASADPVDRASAEEEHRLVLNTRARDAGQLVEVRAALARIAAGDFGYCTETGDPVGIARLLIRPTTVLTTEAQQRQESQTRRFRA